MEDKIMAKSTITTEYATYFENVKNLPEVREVLIRNLDKIDNADFIKAFTKAYNANRDKMVSKYGAYKARCAVTPNGYIKIAKAIKAITEIKVGRRKIKINVEFKLGGINLSGETKAIRKILGADHFMKWNPKTEEWYNSFTVMPKIPTIPESVKPVLEATQKPVKKSGKPKLAKAKKIEGKEAEAIMAEFKAKVSARKASRERSKTTLSKTRTA